MSTTARSILRLLHYWWPAVLGWSTAVVVQRATGQPPNRWGLATLLFGIVAAYTLDRLVEPPLAGTPRWLTRVLRATSALAVALCAIAASRLPVETAALVPLFGSASLLYPRLKRVRFMKTMAVPAVWTWASLALPFGDGSWLGWRTLQFPVAMPLMLLIAAGCMLCDLKDEQADRRAGVPSVPALLGPIPTVRIAMALVLLAAAFAVAEHRPGLVLTACALGLTTVSPSLLATDAAGPLLVDVVLTLPGILISTRVV